MSDRAAHIAGLREVVECARRDDDPIAITVELADMLLEPITREQIKAAIDAWGDTGFSIPLAEYLARHLNGESLPGPVVRQ